MIRLLLIFCCVLAAACSISAKPLTKEDYRKFAMLKQGDALKGKQLFADEQRLACSRCHSVNGQSTKAGPDLFAIGDKSGRREIIDSVLLPSATIAEGYGATTVETKSGDEHTGIIKQATDDWIELMGGDGKLIRIPVGDIEARRTSEISLMPEGLESALSVQEFNDLIEYLVSLKQPASAAQIEHGMPTEIVQLAKPVAVSPFIPEDLQFAHPVWFGQVPGETSAFFVVEHESGKVWRLEFDAGRDGPAADASLSPSDGERAGLSRRSQTKAEVRGSSNVATPAKTVFVETGVYQKGTRGLLGMALHPKFRQNRKYYLPKHRVENGKFATLILELEAAEDFKSDSGKPPRVILKIDEPGAGHYGGGLQFGPDGFFYVGTGDGGPQEDPQGHGQNTQLLIGKMLRIDLDHLDGDKLYSIPSDNPFLGREDFRPEIWAYGLREPWRYSFDPLTGDLWAGDVGQDRYEEIDIIRRGENYGWNVYEGFEPFSNRYRRPGETYVAPVFSYGRKYGPSVTGGYVYRRDPHSSFYGVYIFGDYESRRVFGLTQTNRVLKTIRQVATAPQRVVSFGRDNQGELYIVGYEGMIYKLDFTSALFE